MKDKFKFKILQEKKTATEIMRRIKVLPTDRKSNFTLDDIRNFYKYLTEELKIQHKNIMLFSQHPDKYRSIKQRNEDEINLLDVEEYYRNRVRNVSKFVDDAMSLDVYIFKKSPFLSKYNK